MRATHVDLMHSKFLFVFPKSEMKRAEKKYYRAREKATGQ